MRQVQCDLHRTVRQARQTLTGVPALLFHIPGDRCGKPRPDRHRTALPPHHAKAVFQQPGHRQFRRPDEPQLLHLHLAHAVELKDAGLAVIVAVGDQIQTQLVINEAVGMHFISDRFGRGQRD